MDNATPRYVVIQDGPSFHPTQGYRRRWAICDTVTDLVVDGGFFSKDAAEDYLNKEYTR